MFDDKGQLTKAARSVVICVTLGLFCVVPAIAKTIDVEFLQTNIDPRSVAELSGLACRNYDHVVHVDISVDWPSEAVDEEQSGYEGLVFRTDRDKNGFGTEYLFPKGSYFFLRGSYIVKGYFIVRSGGMHQGVSSIAFQRVDDATVLLNPAVKETKTKGSRCP